MKQKCAKEAAKMIKDNMIVGFGGGSTVSYLIEEIACSNKKVFAVTPSMDTEEICLAHNIQVLPLSTISEIDIAFDGCDEVDVNLNAIKSCGGIHSREKIVAAMAKKYILLADESKYSKQLQFTYPVTVEVLPSARRYVKKELRKLGADISERHCSNKTGLTITDDGNYLMEAIFDIETELIQGLAINSNEGLRILDQKLNSIAGIVGHGLFYHVASGVIIAGRENARVLMKA